MKLEELFNVYAGGDLNKPCYSPTFNNVHKYPIFSNSLENNGLFGYTSEPKYKHDSITVTGRGNVGHAFYRGTDFDAIIRLLVLEPKPGINSRYFTYLINNNISFPIESTGVPQLTRPQLQNTEINLIHNQKQQHHIVNIMESVDNLITASEARLKKYILLYDGIIFKTIGSKQIAESEWTKYSISQLFNVGRGRVINQLEIDKSYTKKYPVFSSQTTNDGIMGYIDSYDFEGDYITWTTDGANAGTVFLRNGRFNCTNVCGTLKLKKEADVNLYLASKALSFNAKKYVSSNLANPKLMNNVMKKITIWLPDSIEEQKQLANTINDFEIKIETEKQLLTKYKSIREGLLNALFTGKIDVPADYKEV